MKPDQIDFDDDIALLISTWIKLNKGLTETHKTMFQWFEGIHTKYNGIFGNLLVWLNMYIIYNDGWLCENPFAVKSTFEMATKSLFYNKKKVYNVATNCDGVILYQLLLQYLSSPSYDEFFEETLANTTKRINLGNPSDVLQSILVGTYLSAMIYSPEATFKYLEQENIIEGVFEKLFTLDSKMFHTYQRKLYLIGLGKSLFSEYIPEFVKNNIVKIISKMILMLWRINLAEKYKEKKIQIEQAKDEEEKLSKIKPKSEILDNYDEENIELELKEINEFFEKESNGLLGSANDINNPPFIIQHEKREEMEGDETKDHEDHLNDSWWDESEYDDEDAMENEKEEIEMEFDMLWCKVKEADENQFFKLAMSKLYHQNPEEMSSLINQLSEKQRDFMKKLLQTQRLIVNENGETKQITRRVIKALRRNK